ncbi:MAG: response regulator [Deltaproteobacteria bacterium]|nr:response regulator [Deltaproteobacteria bacterium]
MANVLLWADNPEIREVLGKKGHKLFNFTDKESALECIRSQKLELALVEVDRPAGLEVMQELRQLSPDLRLLMITGAPDLSCLRQAIRLGVQEILFTPLDPAELESKVAKVAKATKRNLKEALAL